MQEEEDEQVVDREEIHIQEMELSNELNIIDENDNCMFIGSFTSVL